MRARPRRKDGPGPLAKVLHQRANRAQEARKLQRNDTPRDELVRLEITPGTDLMCEVDMWVRGKSSQIEHGEAEAESVRASVVLTLLFCFALSLSLYKYITNDGFV